MVKEYELNRYLFENLSKYHITMADIAKCLNKTVSAVSQNVKKCNFTMREIADIAELGRFTHGSFMRLVGGSSDHIGQMPEYQVPKYKLFDLYDKLKGRYGSQVKMSKRTGVSVAKIRMLQQKGNDEKYGEITDISILPKILYKDFLSLISAIDDARPELYIIDEQGIFPHADNNEKEQIPKQFYEEVMKKKNTELQGVTMAKEEFERKYKETQHNYNDVVSANKKLNRELNEEKKAHRDKRDTITSMRAENSRMKNDVRLCADRMNDIMKDVKERCHDFYYSAYGIKLIKELEILKNTINQ